MAWKVLSCLQAVGQPAAADYPGGAYRTRVVHTDNYATWGAYWATLIGAGRYVIPYVEVPYTAGPANATNEYLFGWTDAAWEAEMTSLASELAGAGVEYLMLGNEIKRVSTVASYRKCWDTYIRAMEITAPIMRAAGVALMCSSLGFTRYEKEFMDYLASKAAFRLFDAKSVHIYSGGQHADGSDANGLPADCQRKLEDCRAAMNSAGPGHPEMDLYVTEHGWPGVPAKTTGTVTAGSNVITGVADTTDFVTTRPVRAATLTATSTLLFPATATLTSKTANTLTLSVNATLSATGAQVLGGVKATDPGHQSYCTEAQQATRITDSFGRWYGGAGVTVSKANRARLFSVFTSTDYSPASAPTQTGEYTDGGWPLHCGLKYENSPNVSQDYTNKGGTGHKDSWAAFDAIADGLGTSGVKPAVVTGAASAITGTTATIAGTVDPNSLDAEWYVQYGLDANFGKQHAIQPAVTGASPVAVSRPLTALAPDQTYYYRFVAWNDAGTSWGDTETFVSTAGPAQTILTAPVTPTVRSAGAGANPVQANEMVGDAEPALEPGTQYFYRLVAVNSAGTHTGAQQSFTTQDVVATPVVTTGAATDRGLTKATLNGIIDPNGATLDWQFEWGETSAYGTSSPAVQVSGTEPISVSYEVTDLEPDTEYHYELTTSTGIGGGDRTFQTVFPGLPPVKEPGGPSLAVSVQISTFDGRLYRLDPDDADPQNRPYELQFGTAAGDGFAESSFVTYRPMDIDWPDLALFSRVQFIGADGFVVYEGRTAGIPRSIDDSGERIQVTCQGLMASSRDRPFMEVYCDRSGDRWQQAGLGLRLAYATALMPLDVDYAPQVDTGSLSFKGATQKAIQQDSQGVLVWKGPTGTKGSSIQYRGDDKGTSFAARCDVPRIYARDVAGVVIDTTNWDYNSLTFDNTLRGANLTTPRDVLAFRLRALADHTPTQNQACHRVIHQICVYGDHGVALRDNGSEPDGVFASDVIKDIIARFCPLLDGSQVVPTETVVDHLVFETPTAPFDAFTLLNGYHLYLLAAWEKGRVQFEPADLTKADWLVRSNDPGVVLDLHGDTVDEVANGIVVSYTDIDERQRVLMPKDSTGGVLYTELIDSDPDNPVNREGLTKWITLELSNPATLKMALVLGQVALAEHNRPKSPGTVTVASGYVKDALQNLQPSYKVRYGQTLSIMDLPNESPRLITATSWNEDGTLSITLEQPPTRVDAVLARLDLAAQTSGIG